MRLPVFTSSSRIWSKAYPFAKSLLKQRFHTEQHTGGSQSTGDPAWPGFLVCLDCGLPPAWSRALAEWCRLDESQIQALDLKQRYPGRGLNWFSHRRALLNNSGLAAGSPWLATQVLCPLRAAAGQGRSANPSADGVGARVHAHCPEHFGEPLWQHCLCCHREDSGWIIVARRRHGNEVRCRYCTVAFHHWSQPDAQPLAASLQVTLRLESTLLGAFVVSRRIRFG